MKILHVNLSDRIGGASIAMHRIHHGLRQLGVDSNLLVQRLSDPALVDEPEINLISTGWSRKVGLVKYKVATRLGKMQQDPASFFCSINFFPNHLLKQIEKIKPDLVNLHWVGAEILHIEDLPKIGVPIAWTLMDMWPFCGAEHYDFGDRFRNAYDAKSRDPKATGTDWNQKVWRRKYEAWSNTPVTTVSPSTWIQECAQDSSLWRGRSDCHHEMIPFGLDASIFRPRDKQECRTKHNLHGDKPLLLFGADNISSPMKGMSWLIEAIKELHETGFQFRIASFGRGDITAHIDPSIESVSLGSISSPETLSEIYCAADLMLVPSRLESFGQTASEANASGTPVVCFDISGVTDIVVHKETGYRAEPYSPVDLAKGIRWCLESEERLEKLGKTAATRANQLFDIKSVAKQYKELYERMLSH